MKRRDFLLHTAGAFMVLPISSTLLASMGNKKKKVSVGIITDLHQDVMHDGKSRLEVFLKEMKKIRPDAIMQMGDFAYPGDKNKEVIDLFNNAHATRMHVIGNHDTDAKYTKEQCINYWGMPAKYYKKEVNGISFIILDGNDKGSPTHKGGYPDYINEEQVNWLKQTISATQGPVVVVSHQPLAGPLAVDNAAAIQEILSASADKILLAINGHTHIDMLLEIKGVRYVHINSASYFWVSGNHKHEMYSKEIHTTYPYISSVCPYHDALFTTLTIDLKAGHITLAGRKSEWVGQSPADLGYVDKDGIQAGKEIVPFISARKLETAVKSPA